VLVRETHGVTDFVASHVDAIVAVGNAVAGIEIHSPIIRSLVVHLAPDVGPVSVAGLKANAHARLRAIRDLFETQTDTEVNPALERSS